MDAVAALIGAIALAALVGSPILAIVAFQSARRSRELADRLAADVARLKIDLNRVSAELRGVRDAGQGPSPVAPGAATADAERSSEAAAEETPDEQVTGEPEEAPEPAVAPPFVFTDEQLARYDASHLAILQRMLSVDTADLTVREQRRHQTELAEIATRIRAKIGYTGAVPDDAIADFLAAFAEALRQRLAAVPTEVAPTEGATVEPEPARRGFEETLASQWMVWLGAATVGLGAVFLFNYAIEQGWLVPIARVSLGLALGIALVLGGEWLHRRAVSAPDHALGPDYVPPALTASGLFALFVSVYAAHALYALVGSAVAFAALGGVAFAALLLALRHGWFVGLLGLVGGYAIPQLLQSDEANALPVFLFLAVLTAGCLGLMVWRKWWWLSYATLIGALAWPVLWLAGPWSIGDQGVLGLYGLALAGLFAFFSVNLPVKRPGTPATAWLAGMLADTSGLGFVLSGILLVILANAAEFNDAAFVFLGVYAAIGLLFGIRRAAYESLAVAGALIVVVCILIWPPPVEITVPEDLIAMGVARDVSSFGPYLMPAEFKAFARALLGFGILFGLGGLIALRRGATPAIWAGISAAIPLYLFVMGYWRIAAFEVDVRWSTIAVGLSLFNLAAAALLPRLLGPRPTDAPLAIYAAGCTGAIALAFTCVLREAWLTVALSTEVLALAWIWTRLRVAEIRAVAYLVVAAVVIRLVLNDNIIDYQGSVLGPFSWVVYGYGLPALAIYVASRLFGDPRTDMLAGLCQAVAAGLAFLMVALQLRIWTSGAIDHPRYDLFDQSIQSVWWLLVAALLLYQRSVERAVWARWAGYGLLALAAMQVLFGQVLGNSPLFSHQPVGAALVVNLLLLAYGVPAVLLWLLGTSRHFALAPELCQILRIAASVLVFVFVTLQVRHFYWGSEMELTRETLPTGAEIYSYSAIWIVYALALLALGIVQRSAFWRYSSLAVLIVTVLKVFLYDMSDLTGLYRVASFVGLGLTLIAIGHVYRRFVFRA